jgi:hypothetical protein
MGLPLVFFGESFGGVSFLPRFASSIAVAAEYFIAP